MLKNAAKFMFVVSLIQVVVSATLMAQRNYDHARDLTSQTNADLRKISQNALSGKERERYDNALKHLSEFDQGLSRSKYDHDKLNEAIEDVDNVCKNNAVGPEERDALQRDLHELRVLRDDWK